MFFLDPSKYFIFSSLPALRSRASYFSRVNTAPNGRSLAATQPWLGKPYQLQEAPEGIWLYPGMWGPVLRAMLDANRGLVSLGGSTAGRWMAPGTDLAFIWSDNGDICDLPWFVAGSQEPYTPFRGWGLRQSHQQAIKMKQSAGWQGGTPAWAGPTGTPHSPPSPLSTAKWPGPAPTCDMQPLSHTVSSEILELCFPTLLEPWRLRILNFLS